MKRFIASLLCVLLAAPGCTAGTARVQTVPSVPVSAADPGVIGDFARQIPIGARIKATVSGHHVIRGTLLKRTDLAIVIQPRARIAEPPVEVAFANLVALEQEDTSSGTGRAVAIGVGVGVGAALLFLMILAAALGD